MNCSKTSTPNLFIKFIKSMNPSKTIAYPRNAIELGYGKLVAQARLEFD